MKGFRLRKRFAGFFSRIFCRRRRISSDHACVYRRQLQGSGSSVFTWMRRKAAGFLNRKRTGYNSVRLGQAGRVGVPKGHLAVYVGQKEDDCCRVLVPVIYLNHPLFGGLLSEAEDKFGFEYPGRITIPCPVSEFESVTTRIEAAVRRRRGVRR